VAVELIPAEVLTKLLERDKALVDLEMEMDQVKVLDKV
jgi:hypothetical protein